METFHGILRITDLYPHEIIIFLPHLKKIVFWDPKLIFPGNFTV
jgi:hypothetical protein